MLYARLQAAEAHIAGLVARDDEILSKIREAEAMVNKERAKAEKTMGEARKIIYSSTDVLEREHQADQSNAEKRAQKLDTALVEVTRRVQDAEGRFTLAKFQTEGSIAATKDAEDRLALANARYDDLRAAAENRFARDKERITDLEARLARAEIAASVAQADIQALSDLLSARQTEAQVDVAEAKQQPDRTKARVTDAQSCIRDLQSQLSDANTRADEANPRPRGAKSRVTQIKAEGHQRLDTTEGQTTEVEQDLRSQLSDVQSRLEKANLRARDAEEHAAKVTAEATTEREKAALANAACAHAVLRVEREEKERRAAEATLEALRKEAASPLMAPALVDAMRAIVHSSFQVEDTGEF
jgi:chromosome segregation ATPase